MNIELILKAALYLVLIVLGGGMAWLTKLKIGDENFNKLLDWIDLAINAAEAQIKGTKQGTKRKAVVMEKLTAQTNVDEEVLSDLIDSRVQSEINGEKKEVK